MASRGLPSAASPLQGLDAIQIVLPSYSGQQPQHKHRKTQRQTHPANSKDNSKQKQQTQQQTKRQKQQHKQHTRPFSVIAAVTATAIFSATTFLFRSESHRTLVCGNEDRGDAPGYIIKSGSLTI
eukprot:GHVS01049593.1.p2 GENE.GHVS01049593.1~~GHVS01049593.1.p2  ORF type:complete len:125 (-),score=31.85 GHVS01049593.1:12-386(-)